MSGAENILKGCKRGPLRDILIFIGIFAAGIFFTMNANVRNGEVRYPGKIWSDAAHYYVYMPATFIYNWNIYLFPYQIDKRFEGFALNTTKGKVETKTTCGEAILLTPFFLAAHASAFVFDKPMDGFSNIYQMFMLVGCVFYFTLGLFFLKKFLDRYFSHGIALSVVLLLTLTTQLFFYAYDQALMSHTYSFFLFSAFLYLLKLYLDGGKKSYRLFVLISLSLSMAVLLRPTNLMVILWFAFLDLKSAREFWQRLLFFLNPKRSLIYIAIQFIVLIPQFLYWHYYSGKYIFYSYPGEVFFWFHPMILQTWFSPFNGLFPHHPVFLLLIAGLIFMIWRKKPNGIFSLVFFLFISYVFACWHCWFYGGSFGHRPVTEFIVFLALPLGYLLISIMQWKNLFLRSTMAVLFIMLIHYNLVQFYRYQIFTGGMWSWDDFFQRMKGYELVFYPQKTYEWNTDFSNIFGYDPVILTWPRPYSPYLATFCSRDIPENVRVKRQLSKILDHPVRKISMSVWVCPQDADSTNALWICRVQKEGCVIFSDTISFNRQVQKKDVYQEVTGTIYIPEWVDQDSEIEFFVWNAKGREFYFDDMSIKFE